jgi:hypothetical protein
MPTDPGEASQPQRVWPFPEEVPGAGRSNGNASTPPAADQDLLGDAMPMRPPTSEIQPPAVGDAGAGIEGAAPGPAEDENQPGFIGNRNLPGAA